MCYCPRSFALKKMSRSVGLVLHSVKSLGLSEVTINLNYGEKIPHKFLMAVGASNAFFLSHQVITFLMPRSASRLSSTRFG